MKIILVLTACIAYTYAGLAGGPRDITDEAKLSDASVQFGLSAINDYFKANSNGVEVPERTAVQIIKATSQVVAGAKYHYTLKVTDGKNVQICESTVWVKEWLDFYQSLGVECGPSMETPQARGGMLGGWKEIPFNAPRALPALRKLINRVNGMHNGMYRLTPIGGTVTYQVVNGINYRFKSVSLVKTGCRNNGDMQANCAPTDDNVVMRVDGKVYMPPGDGEAIIQDVNIV